MNFINSLQFLNNKASLGGLTDTSNGFTWSG